MGEITEMMLDGTICEKCGDYLGDAVGYPRYCEACLPKQQKNRKRKGDKYGGCKIHKQTNSRFKK